MKAIKAVCKWIGTRWVFWHIAAIIWMVIWTLILTFVRHPDLDSASIIYTKIHIRDHAGQILFLPPVFIVFSSSIFNIFLNRSSRSIVFYFIGPVLTTIGWFVLAWFIGPLNPYGLASTVYNWPDPDTRELFSTPRIEHLQSMGANGYVYNFLRYEILSTLGVSLPIHTYHLYECDSLGISCTVVYRYDVEGWDEVHDDWENDPYFEREGDLLHIYIAGELAHSYTLK